MLKLDQEVKWTEEQLCTNENHNLVAEPALRKDCKKSFQVVKSDQIQTRLKLLNHLSPEDLKDLMLKLRGKHHLKLYLLSETCLDFNQK